MQVSKQNTALAADMAMGDTLMAGFIQNGISQSPPAWNVADWDTGG